MCNDKAMSSNIESLPYWKEIEKELYDFQNDGIIDLKNNEIHVTTLGKGFVRNVAMSFDYHFREQQSKVKFSQTI